MTLFWSLWVIVLTIVTLVLVAWVLFANRKVAVRDDEDPENRTTGHSYDGIEEFDNPLPKWWFQLFVYTFVFLIIYLILYPGMGNFKGILGWTSVNELRNDQDKAQAQYIKSYGVFNEMSVEELIHDARARKMGIRLFANNCAVCHGADGGGNYGFPNLRDNDWLYGGSPEDIKTTLINGRNGAMPPLGAVLGEQKVTEVVDYVLQISGQIHDIKSAQAGKTVFEQNCSVCHRVDGTGNHAIGSPNLTDDIWLYDGSREGIANSIRNGRSNQMPAQKDILREDKIHVLTAYVYSLSFDYQ